MLAWHAWGSSDEGMDESVGGLAWYPTVKNISADEPFESGCESSQDAPEKMWALPTATWEDDGHSGGLIHVGSKRFHWFEYT